MKILFDYNRTIFDPSNDALYPGVFEMLQKISKDHDLYLVSQFEVGRDEKFLELGIHQYFKDIRFVKTKTPELFSELLGSGASMIVGDSLSNEILIGNKLGILTVHVDRGIRPIELAAVGIPDFRIHTLEEIVLIIQRHEN